METLAQQLKKLLQLRPGHTAGQYAVMLDADLIPIKITLGRWERNGIVKKELEYPDRPEQSYSNQYIYYLNE